MTNKQRDIQFLINCLHLVEISRMYVGNKKRFMKRLHSSQMSLKDKLKNSMTPGQIRKFNEYSSIT